MSSAARDSLLILTSGWHPDHAGRGNFGTNGIERPFQYCCTSGHCGLKQRDSHDMALRVGRISSPGALLVDTAGDAAVAGLNLVPLIIR